MAMLFSYPRGSAFNVRHPLPENFFDRLFYCYCLTGPYEPREKAGSKHQYARIIIRLLLIDSCGDPTLASWDCVSVKLQRITKNCLTFVGPPSFSVPADKHSHVSSCQAMGGGGIGGNRGWYLYWGPGSGKGKRSKMHMGERKKKKVSEAGWTWDWNVFLLRNLAPG